MTNTPLGTQTIQNALKKEDLVAQVKVKKPFLSTKHRKARREFAEKYEHGTEEDWACVMFTDETKINRIGLDEKQWVWKRAGAPLQSQHILQTIKFGEGYVMIWGCITTAGVGLMYRIEGKMDAELYEEILEDHVFQTLEYYDLDSSNFIF
jgi:hypothetical protein